MHVRWRCRVTGTQTRPHLAKTSALRVLPMMLPLHAMSFPIDPRGINHTQMRYIVAVRQGRCDEHVPFAINRQSGCNACSGVHVLSPHALASSHGLVFREFLSQQSFCLSNLLIHAAECQNENAMISTLRARMKSPVPLDCGDAPVYCRFV